MYFMCSGMWLRRLPTGPLVGPARSTRALHPIPGRRRLARHACVAQARAAAMPPAGSVASLSPHRAPSRLPNPRSPPASSPHPPPPSHRLVVVVDVVRSSTPPPPPPDPPFFPSPPRSLPPRLTCACHAQPASSRRPRPRPPPHHGGLCRGCGVCADGGFPAGWRAQRPPADRLDGDPASGGASGRVGHLDEGAE